MAQNGAGVGALLISPRGKKGGKEREASAFS